ncbi:hypothetical protein V8E36_005597 [Tilletia maclaganii]
MAASKLAPHRKTPVMTPARAAEFISKETGVEPAAVPDAPTEPIPASAYFDLVIIGSGPAALALITRVMEKRPAALFLEDEHRYLHWLHSKDSAGGPSRKEGGGKPKGRSATRDSAVGSAPLLRSKYRPGTTERVFVKGAEDRRPPSSEAKGVRAHQPIRILIIDRIGGWLGLWNRLFAAYEIPHLRSPMFFHPSPADLDALVAFAERTRRNTTGTWQPQPIRKLGDAANIALERPKKVDRIMRKRLKQRSPDLDDISEHCLEEPVLRGHTNHAGPELIEINGCVGKEITKHRRKKARAQHHHNHGGNRLGAAVNERDRRDYFTPGTKLFQDFVATDLIKRYNIPGGDASKPWPSLAELLRHSADTQQEREAALGQLPVTVDQGGNTICTARGEVNFMSWHQNLHIAGQGHSPAMLIRTADGCTLAAGTVVSAIGPGGVPNVPDVLKAVEQRRAEAEGVAPPAAPKPFGQGWCHSAALALPTFSFPPPSILKKIESASSKSLTSASSPGPTCVVIGGGLTSAQLCILALRKGFGKVILVLRGHLKVKPFDVTLDWLSKWANTMKMQFWQEDDPAQRLAMLRGARNGGSITPSYARYLRELERTGVLEVRTHSEIERLEWEADTESWDVKLRCTCADAKTGLATDAEEDAANRTDDVPAGATALHQGCEPCAEPACTGEPGAESDSESQLDRKSTQATTEERSEAVKPPSETAGGIGADPETPSDKDERASFRADYILTSTRPILSLPTLPAFKSLAQTHPCAFFGGLPLISEDLQWMSPLNSAAATATTKPSPTPCTDRGVKTEQPRLFMVGAYSALQVGPAAFNLGGMREAAERVGSRLIRDWEAEAAAAEAEGQLVVGLGAGDDSESASELGTEEEEGSEGQDEIAGARSARASAVEPWQTGRWSSLDGLLQAA